ncbi:MAG: hypothetical protein HOP27_01605 [Anaerolineales bacterium]|nr:hypothetical protein [Anaerolineales bacterium]
MTRVALISSILIGIGSLAWGYSEIGLNAVTRWIIILGAAWLVTLWNGVRWFSSFALVLVILASAFGLWFRFAPGWMFSGGIFALVAWDLTRFRQRLIFLPAREDKRGMERRHIARLSLLSLIGLFIASITMFLRGAFTNEWGVLLLIVTVLDLAQLIGWLRKR